MPKTGKLCIALILMLAGLVAMFWLLDLTRPLMEDCCPVLIGNP